MITHIVLALFIMRIISIILLVTIAGGAAAGQNSLQKLVDTEYAFAAMAAEKNTRTAFLTFLADDGVVFNPQRSNGKQVWTARKETPALLSWYPVFADISSNGLIGYTTGPWEYRPKGKDDAPAAFGHYMTIWQKQLDGNFRAVLDFGVFHDKPPVVETRLTSAAAVLPKTGEVKTHAGDATAEFFDMVSHVSLAKAYQNFAADDIRMMRSDKQPIIGKRAALKEIAGVKAKLFISNKMSFYGTDDIAYASNVYMLAQDGKTVETGNFVQIWKNRGGKWLIVMDIFVADPKDKSS
jgi:ketosteroid isomerase-like protein